LASPFDKALHYDVRQIVETTANHVVQLLQRRALLEEGTVHPLGSCINSTSPTGTDRNTLGDSSSCRFLAVTQADSFGGSCFATHLASPRKWRSTLSVMRETLFS
jgi:hypothetical protein